MSRRLKFVAAMLVQFAILGAMVISAELTLKHGLRVELEVEPFDPIDPLSGRHLVVNLAAARIDRRYLDPAIGDDLVPGDALFVTLDTSVTPAIVVGASRSRPLEGIPFARATVRDVSPSLVRVDYGLERYFIPLDAEDPSLFRDANGRRAELRLVVRIDDDGRIVTEDLLVDGAPFSEWNARQREGR